MRERELCGDGSFLASTLGAWCSWTRAERISRVDRLRSRAPRGLRAYGKVPKNRGKNLTLIALMSLHGMGESMCVEGATDAAASFEAYVEHFLAPKLSEGQVVVMDNLGAHRPKRIRELIEARGAEVVFVPSYSPDLNAIEQAFSKIKNVLRKLQAHTHEALLEAMEEALSKLTPADAARWFDHCGYQVEVCSTCECRCKNTGTLRRWR
jgi:transposase